MTKAEIKKLPKEQQLIIKEYKALPIGSFARDDRAARRRDYIIEQYNKIIHSVHKNDRLVNRSSNYYCDQNDGGSF